MLDDGQEGTIMELGQAFKTAIEERIKDLMEVHAPVDLTRHHCHGHSH